MTYSESARGVTITYQRAMQELTAHGVCDEDREAFASEVKPNCAGEYSATKVLEWLGY